MEVSHDLSDITAHDSLSIADLEVLDNNEDYLEKAKWYRGNLAPKEGEGSHANDDGSQKNEDKEQGSMNNNDWHIGPWTFDYEIDSYYYDPSNMTIFYNCSNPCSENICTHMLSKYGTRCANRAVSDTGLTFICQHCTSEKELEKKFLRKTHEEKEQEQRREERRLYALKRLKYQTSPKQARLKGTHDKMRAKYNSDLPDSEEEQK